MSMDTKDMKESVLNMRYLGISKNMGYCTKFCILFSYVTFALSGFCYFCKDQHKPTEKGIVVLHCFVTMT